MPASDPIKVYDARWEVKEFDDAAVRRLFEATYLYGRELGVDTLVLTRDARLGAARVIEIGMEEALRIGWPVYLNPKPASTTQGYFTAMQISRERPNTMGLVITASHNPAQYIGVKFTVPTVRAIGEDCGPLRGLTKIREIYHSAAKFESSARRGVLTMVDMEREYVDFSLQHANVRAGELKGMTIVLDAYHGSAGPEIYEALTKAGAKVLPLRIVPNGEFPTGSPNPTSQGKMNAAVELAKKEKADAVIGVDGDGDRIVFGDARGILTAGFAFVPILRACIGGQNNPAALYDPKVSPLALAEWGKLGARPVLFRNGHSQIKDYMTQIGAIAAAEESGHYYHRFNTANGPVSAENSTMTILLFLASLKKEPGLMKDLWAMQDKIATTGEFNYQFKDDVTRDAALAAVVDHFTKDGAGAVTTTADGIELQGTCLNKGVKLDPGAVKLERGWYSGYLRVATNEKGVVRSYFSTGDQESLGNVESASREILAEKFDGKVIE